MINKTNNQHSQRGFTLVEMAIVILILGLIVGSVFAYLDVQSQERQQQVTRVRQQKIIAALAGYAQSHGRLPCPGAPDDVNLGWPVGYNVNTRPSGDCATPAQRDGIVPFRALGLTRDDVMDGYNNAFTFVVDDAAGRQQTAALRLIHRNCRIGDTTAVSANDWVPMGTANRAPDKALLCCPRVTGQQIQIFNTANLNAASRVLLQPPTTTATDFDADANVATTPDSAASLAYEAFVLISHGQNGAGAYRFDQAGRPSLAGMSQGETENADNDVNFVDLPRNTSVGNDYFDDIVVWRTQEGLMGEFGNDSCARP